MNKWIVILGAVAALLYLNRRNAIAGTESVSGAEVEPGVTTIEPGPSTFFGTPFDPDLPFMAPQPIDGSLFDSVEISASDFV